ncbi:MAG: S8 family peptidase [Candidatus Eisenbacteria bacterium]|nr:S8 family peptidase [Candidatus Eisenbacteria bacterium]
MTNAHGTRSRSAPRTFRAALLFLLTLTLSVTSVSVVFCSAGAAPDVLGPSLRLLLASRDRLDRVQTGSLCAVAARPRCHVTVRFDRPLSESELAGLESEGVEFERLDGRVCRAGNVYGAFLPWDLLEQLRARPGVRMIESVWRPRMLPVLDVSAPEIQAPQAWEQLNLLEEHLTGQGMVVADLDTGVDVFHPHLWRADGDTLNWLDVNENEAFDSGVDAVDLNCSGTPDPGETLRFFDGRIYDPARTFGGSGTSNNDGVFQSHWDWLYNDANDNGARDQGPAAGYDEDSPTYGERLFVLLDEDADLALDVNERLVALATCKVAATLNTDNVERVRGEDLIDTDPDTNGHGTSVCGILAGGVRGVSRFCGIAPDAEVVVGNFFSDLSLVTLLDWARARGADLVLYEGAGFVWAPLDGSTNDELTLDAAADSMLQVTPAGNLCRGNKHAQMALDGLATQDITLYSPASYGGAPINYIWTTLLWRTPSNDVSFSLTTPEDVSALLLGTGTYQTIGSYEVYSLRTTSPRGTAEFDVQIHSASGVEGNWTLDLTSESEAEEEVNAYVADDASSWAGGAEFTNYLSTDKTVCWPATADSAFTLASYSTRGYVGYEGVGDGSVEPGELSEFSSRGKRIDGVSVLEIAAPGNYDVYTSRSHYPAGSTFGGFRQFSGTSAAGPHVAAGAAVVLQASPDLTPFGIKQRITAAAERDEFTGPDYNDSWGFGKLRILDAVAPLILVAQADAPYVPGGSLAQNYPNPFNPVTTVTYLLPSSETREKFSIRVFDAQGRLTRTLLEAQWGPEPLRGTTTWTGTDEDGRPVSSGVYFIRLEAKAHDSYVKAVLIR